MISIRKGGGYSFKSQEIYLVSGGKLYGINATSVAATCSRHESAFNAMINSVKFR